MLPLERWGWAVCWRKLGKQGTSQYSSVVPAFAPAWVSDLTTFTDRLWSASTSHTASCFRSQHLSEQQRSKSGYEVTRKHKTKTSAWPGSTVTGYILKTLKATTGIQAPLGHCFVIHNSQEECTLPRSPSTDEWEMKIQNIYTMNFYLAKRKKMEFFCNINRSRNYCIRWGNLFSKEEEPMRGEKRIFKLGWQKKNLKSNKIL